MIQDREQMFKLLALIGLRYKGIVIGIKPPAELWPVFFVVKMVNTRLASNKPVNFVEKLSPKRIPDGLRDPGTYNNDLHRSA